MASLEAWDQDYLSLSFRGQALTVSLSSRIQTAHTKLDNSDKKNAISDRMLLSRNIITRNWDLGRIHEASGQTSRPTPNPQSAPSVGVMVCVPAL